ncbi:MAG: NAD(P)-dependent alcohol dehydrogenase [Alphaproteobacteria bacterium]|nr:NAD(P)-dependent alcohol dehydrogenase [Alphaproteobacteria bacterium]
MKAMRIEGDWGLDHLKLVDLPEPAFGPDDVLIRMAAISINPRDRILVEGGYGRMAGPLPLIPLCDGAGHVVDVGAEVKHIAAGDLVCPAYSRTWLDGTAGEHTHDGSHGGMIDGTAVELMTVPAEAVVKAPGHLDATEAATLPCAAVTAWNAIVETGGVKAGDAVLLQGTGGVSLFALQFAKMQGARTILISSSDEKLARASELGADHLINYRAEPDWHKHARNITDGRGVDHVVDIGGAGALERSIAAVRPSGMISLIGVLGGAATGLGLGRVVTRHVRLQGITVGSSAMFERMVRAMALHATKPVVDQERFALEGLGDALDRLSAGAHIGKIVGTI